MKNKIINYNTLVNEIAKETGNDSFFINSIFSLLERKIVSKTQENYSVKFWKLWTFFKSVSKKKYCFHPITKKKMKIKNKIFLKFKQSKSTKNTIN